MHSGFVAPSYQWCCVTPWCCGSGHKYYFILSAVWASAELPACSCLLFHRDGRKRWAERYTGGGDKAVEGEGKQEGEQRWLGGNLRGRGEEHVQKVQWSKEVGPSLPAPPAGRKDGPCQSWLQAPPAAAPLRWLSSWVPLPRVAFTQLQLMHMQSAATYAADR